jgi:tetratricopeptide (TPR) repeat protein
LHEANSQVVSDFSTILPDSEGSGPEADEIYGFMAALESYTDTLGPCHPETLTTANRLAIAFWRAGEVNQAIALLDEVLSRLDSDLGPEHPTRVDMLSTLAKILFEQHHLEQACVIQREVLECRVRHSGIAHPNSLEAKGDLAVILFGLGEDQEATGLEEEAFESARMYLGKTHPVTSVLAWNRALSYERRGDPDFARSVILNELAWLLTEDPSRLDRDQNAVRSMLAERLNWDMARVC